MNFGEVIGKSFFDEIVFCNLYYLGGEEYMDVVVKKKKRVVVVV